MKNFLTSPILKFTHVKNIVFQIYELHTLNLGTSKPLVKNLLKMLTQNFALQNSKLTFQTLYYEYTKTL